MRRVPTPPLHFIISHFLSNYLWCNASCGVMKWLNVGYLRWRLQIVHIFPLMNCVTRWPGVWLTRRELAPACLRPWVWSQQWEIKSCLCCVTLQRQFINQTIMCNGFFWNLTYYKLSPRNWLEVRICCRSVKFERRGPEPWCSLCLSAGMDSDNMYQNILFSPEELKKCPMEFSKRWAWFQRIISKDENAESS